MATRRADLGPASAWAEAVAEGYTGTREDWARALATASTAAQQVAQASGVVTRAAEVDSALQQVDDGLRLLLTWEDGANMIDPAQAVDGRLSSAGTAIGTETTRKTTGWIPVQPMTAYTVKRWDGSRWGVVSYAQRLTAYTDKDLSTAIGAAASDAVMTFTTPESAAYVRFSYEVDNHGALCMAPSSSFPAAWADYGRRYSYAAGIATQDELDQTAANEEAARELADQQLWDGIADEETARQAADQTIRGLMTVESNTREAADQSIRGLIADEFDPFETYPVGAYCIGPGGHLYQFTAEHTGEWNAADADDVGDVGAKFQHIDTVTTYLGETLDSTRGLIAGQFDEAALYNVGAYCIGPDGHLYRFTAAHSGEWSAADVVRVSVGSELTRTDTRITTFGGQVAQLSNRVTQIADSMLQADSTLSISGEAADAKATGDALAQLDDLTQHMPVENMAFLDAETLNLFSGEVTDGFALMGSTATPSNNTLTANNARYNLCIIPIKPNTTYTVTGQLTDGSTGYCKIITATKQIAAGAKLDGSYGKVISDISYFNVTFLSGANDNYLYLYGFQYTSSSRSYYYQVREGAYSGFTTNEVGLVAGRANAQLIVGRDNVDFLDTHYVNLCDGQPYDGLALIGDNPPTLRANNARYNLLIVPIKPNTTYTVAARENDGNFALLKIYTTTKRLSVGETTDGKIHADFTNMPKLVSTFTTGWNDRYMYIYGMKYQSDSRNYFVQVYEGTIPDFTTDEYSVVYSTLNETVHPTAPVRIEPVNSSNFRVYVLDTGSQQYFRHDFTLMHQTANLPYQSESAQEVLCADVWYASTVYAPDGTTILQGNTNFIHYVSNKGEGHTGHVGASHGCAVATWTKFWADGKQINPAALTSPLECFTFRMQEKVVHYLNDSVTSKAMYPSDYSTHAIPTLDENGAPVPTGIEYLDATWEQDNRLTVRNRFDVLIDDVQFTQLHASMLCGFFPHFDNVQVENEDYLWTAISESDGTYTATDMSGTGTTIPLGTTTGYGGHVVTLFGDKYRVTKIMTQNDPARYGKSNVLMWTPPNSDSRIKAYFMPCICGDSGGTPETFNTGDSFDTVSVMRIEYAR